MQYYYGDYMILRLLDEAEFWKRQEKEHTVVIRQITKDLEPKYVEALKKWEEAFAETEGKLVRMVEAIIRSKNVSPNDQGMIELIKFSAYQSNQFVAFLNDMVKNSKAVSNDIVAVTVINHIRRESEYFIGITNAAFQM